MRYYPELEAKAREIARLREVQAIIHWDEACMMPRGGGAGRSEAMASLATLIHEQLTDPAIGELLENAQGEIAELDQWQSANLVNLQREYLEATAVPAELVHASQLAQLRCEQAWREARPKNDWLAVMPLLENLVGLARQQADALADAMGLSRYDALLEVYEPELRVADIEPIFEDLKGFLPVALEQVLAQQGEAEPLEGPFAVEDQRRLSMAVMGKLGFDFDRGRLDVSHHPFCGGVPDDTRITTRYVESGFIKSLMATCHETGHALYQQGLPAQWRQQPVGDSLGAAVHESQSLLMELQVCRSPEFVGFLAPIIREHFHRHADEKAFSADNLHAQVTRVARDYIRVQADEITYPLHVILRFELERALIEERLAVRELPAAWDDAMQRYLGLSTEGNDADGCMQDVHWYAGLFGYFPTYTLGALMAAQWHATVKAALPGLGAEIAKGNLGPLVAWLRENIHARGRQTTMQPLLEEVTGSRLDAGFYKQHIERRYLKAN